MVVSYDGGRVVLRDGRVELREQLPPEAARIADGLSTDLRWIDETPCEGTVIAASMIVKAFTGGLYVPGWSVFTILRTEDDTAIGGIGFHGAPRDGVERRSASDAGLARGDPWRVNLSARRVRVAGRLCPASPTSLELCDATPAFRSKT